jgi:phage terminase small subunit
MIDPIVDLTLKQKRWADKYLETGSGVEASLEAYDITDRQTAAEIGSQNKRKPNVMEYLKEQAGGAAERITEISKRAGNESVRLNANKDILDRAGFKPVDKQEVTGDVKFIWGEDEDSSDTLQST